MNILMIYPEFPDTFWSFKHALKFIGKTASTPPLGLLTIASMLPKDWEKRLVDLNVQRLTDKDLAWADMYFISAMDVQRDSTREVIARCKAQNKTIVAGGPLFTGEYETFPEVDHFVLNEGEITLPPFLADLEKGSARRIYSTPEYADLSTTPIPSFELLDFRKYDSIAIQYSRGCPFNCDFCNITAMLGHRPRTKSANQLIAELDWLYQTGWRRNVFFVDDNFIGNKRQLKEEILPALIEWRKDKTGFLFITEASINLADDEVLMNLLAQAGFISVFIGIETPDEAGLAECNKTQNKGRDLIESVKRMQRHGLQVMGGFIVGFDSDTSSIFQRQVDFIQNSGIVTAMVGMLQAPFGTQLYARLQKENRLVSEMSGDNGDGTTNIIPRMDLDELTAGYLDIIRKIYSPELFYRRIRTFLEEFNPRKMPVTISLNEVVALLRTVIQFGLLGRERKQYWQLFWWVLLNSPEKFPMAITLTVYGYHFRRVSELHIIAHASKKASQPTQPSNLALQPR